jgi:hypothetical protein
MLEDERLKGAIWMTGVSNYDKGRERDFALICICCFNDVMLSSITRLRFLFIWQII